MNGKEERKRFWIFMGVAYGITFLMGLLMWYGSSREIDISTFPNAQMLYPAAGVALGFLVTGKRDPGLPKWFYRFFVLLTAGMMGISILSVIMPDEILMQGGRVISLWPLLSGNVLVLGGVIFWILFLAAGKERRVAYGLNGNRWKQSFFCILLFVALFMGRTVFSCWLSGQLGMLELVFQTPTTWMMLSALFINFFLVAPAFFGEEYGWRYYLQPLLQRKFGMKKGILILGVVWGLWHLPVDFFYYTSPDMGLQAAIGQQITCITISIFFAWVYMKTKNIWVPVILHFLNNNLAAIIGGGGAADALQNQVITWGSLLPAFLINALFFGGFLFAKFPEEDAE